MSELWQSQRTGRLPNPKRVLVLGATGTIGREAARSLLQRGHDVICFVRQGTEKTDPSTASNFADYLTGAELRNGEVTCAKSLAEDGFRSEKFDVLVSCLASRTGEPEDSWAIDHDTHMNALALAKGAGVSHMILLSAICVQKPKLAFQKAKLAFEKALIASGMNYSIVRPTAFFKSLSGQVERVRQGKPFIVFGDGTLTACKPISDRDLGNYLADCLDDEKKHNRILPIGGPGDPITPRQQGELLFSLLEQDPKFTSVPVWLLDALIGIFNIVGRLIPAIARKAELARIGRFYATESMLVLDETTGLYDGAATPSTGSETLAAHYIRLLKGETVHERGEQSVF